MGCLFSKGSDQGEGKEAEEEAPKTYSWDKKDRPDPKDFTIEGLKGETAGRVPGTVNGQQFIINNCQDSCIYIFDHSASVTVDNCTGCKIFIGPSKGSVFLRNCSQCKMVLACQQFRSRDCKSVDILLHCDTQPIIESSTKIRFGCFQYSYPELRDQFSKSGLSGYNNNWSNIHDFTPVPGEENWALLPLETKVEDVLPVPETEQFSQMTVSTDVNDSFVPLSHGKRRKPADESCLILFFHIDNGDETMKKFILNLKNEVRLSLPVILVKWSGLYST
ncbi:protein XRP2-like [Apostichopus japonicus]|uniref:protein XRP2-like n=1 Tax=Stichopus japonicus TaxID=307972 RepID=UPI003AB6EC4B